MAYSNIETLSKKTPVRMLIQYVNDEQRPESEIDLSDANDLCAQRINQYCNEVSDEIDNALRGRYKLPVTQVPSSLQMISDERTLYLIKVRRNRAEMTDSETKIYAELTKRLQRIQEGKEILDLEKVSAAASGGQIFTNKNKKSAFAKFLDEYC